MRKCIRCGKDLSDVMGVIVFVNDSTRSTQLRATDLLMCVDHGGNGGNVISPEEEEAARTRVLAEEPLGMESR